MKKQTKRCIRSLSILLSAAMLLPTLASCNFGTGDYETPTEAETTSDIPYYDHYIAADLMENVKYENYRGLYVDHVAYGTDPKPIRMGGVDFYQGFVLIGGETSSVSELPESFVTFDISGYAGKTLSFVMGSAEINGNNDDEVVVMEVRLDGEQALEEKIYSNDTYRRYTLDLTGKKEMTFIITMGTGATRVGVAEMTVWDSPEDVVLTGHTPDTSVTRTQLVKDLYPYFFREVGDTVVKIYSNSPLPDFVTEDNYVLNNVTSTGKVNLGGRTYDEAFGLWSSSGLVDDSLESMYFNTEGLYSYLSFMVGGEDQDEFSGGSSWLTVYADGDMVFETAVVSDVLPKRYTVPIENCEKLEFEVAYKEGDSHRVVVFDAFVGKTEADVAGSVDLTPADYPEVCKLISNIPPYNVGSQEGDAVYDGTSKFRTFSMAGRKYYEGVILYPTVYLASGNQGAYACFNLEGQFKHLTFTAGILDKSPFIANDKLNIYLDGVLSETIELSAMDLPQKCEVDLKNCRELKIELVGRNHQKRPAYGIADLVVYKNEVVPHDFFPEEIPDYPSTMPLLENIRPYLTFGPQQEDENALVYDGSTIKESFEIGGETKYAGMILQTHVHLDMLGVGGGVDSTLIMATVLIANLVYGAVAFLAADVRYENSFAAFDLHGEFSKVTFTVACSDPDWYIAGMEEETVLQVGSNDEIMETITLSRDMEPTTYTVDIKNTEQLVFFLKCGDSTSAPYAIYDIVVEK